MAELKPFVYWAQTESDICLRVDLKDMQDTDVLIEEDEIEISTLGIGAQGGDAGRRRYHFVVEFFLPINAEESQYVLLQIIEWYYNIDQEYISFSNDIKIQLFSYEVRSDSDGGGIQVLLKKKKSDWWPRLMYQPQKLSWLKVSFLVFIKLVNIMNLIQYYISDIKICNFFL